MRYIKTLTRLAILLLTLHALPAASQDIKDDPGYVELAGIAYDLGVDADREINIHGATLRLVIAAARREDPELAELLATVNGIFVRGFELASLDYDRVLRQESIMNEALMDTGWETFLKVNDPDENVQMYVKANGADIAGIVLVSSDHRTGRTIYLNIVGNIDPEQLSRIGDKFSVGTF